MRPGTLHTTERGEMQTSRRRGGLRRRGALAALTAGAAAACGTGSVSVPSPRVEAPVAPPAPAVPAPVPAEAPATPVAAAPAPPIPKEPVLGKLGPSGIVQPLFTGDGSRVLFYDQPAPGQGGTWSVDLGSGQVARERQYWGYYVAQASLVATPRPKERDTTVLHAASGREWTLPTSGSTVFSADGTLVAYSSGGLVLAGADNQYARRVTLPLNGTVLAWLAAPDGTPNQRLLVSGRNRPGEAPGLWAIDPQRRAGPQLVRSKRLTGVQASPDGTWVAYYAMWNADPNEDGLWVARTDGSLRRKLPLLGSCRWTADNRLMAVPLRAAPGDSQTLWEYLPKTGEARRLTDPAQQPFQVANGDWDVSSDGTQVVFVSAADKGLWHLSVPAEAPRETDPTLPAGPPAGAGASRGKPYRLPFETAPGPSTWYVGQWYGVTTGGYRWRNTTYVQGQGIHFGVDFAAPMGTPVVAVASGKVVAIDGDYGSPPHNVVLQLTDGNIAMYGHLIERTKHVEVGQTVQPGQVVGNSGDSLPPYDGTRNPHLHLEIRKQGRQTATNPVAYFDVAWDDLTLGVWLGALFERNLDEPRKFQFLDDQPDIWFGGPVITNFARPWPV